MTAIGSQTHSIPFLFQIPIFHFSFKKLFGPSFISILETNTTDRIKTTTENSEILLTSMKNYDEEYSTIAQTGKLTTLMSATTLSPPQLSEKYTTIVSTLGSVDDMHEEMGSTVPIITKTEASIDATKNNVDEISKMSSDNGEKNDDTTVEYTQSDLLNISDATTMTAHPTTETREQTKTNVVSASIAKQNDRSRVVSKDDIESIRGRALNFNTTERKQQNPSGVIYVTAPPAQPIPKLSKSFDLSDVSMDNDGMDIHSSEYMSATQRTPLNLESECQSKVI